jgi:hypothetical protein
LQAQRRTGTSWPPLSPCSRWGAGLQTGLGIALVWVFNLWGTVDLLYAFYQGNRVGLEPGQLGAAYFVVTLLVPLLFITHGLVFRLLLRGDGVAAPPDSERAA